MKTMVKDLEKIRSLLENNENFAYTRFSDGELMVMFGVKIIIAPDYYEIGDHGIQFQKHGVEEEKYFIPDMHQHQREAVIGSFQYKAKNYFKGLSNKESLKARNDACTFENQMSLYGNDPEHLTFANLLINGNYSKFIEEVVPLFSDKRVVYVGPRNGDISKLPFDVVKDFRVGPDCIRNDFNLVEEIPAWIRENKIKDHLFLFTAGSLSECVIHRCFENEPENTYMDVGSSLNPFIPGLDGWKVNRGCLKSYWFDDHHDDLIDLIDVWED